MSKLAHSSDEATIHKIERDYRAREDAESAAMTEAELREQYGQFCDGIKKDLDPIEAEYGGCPSFEEFKQAYQGDDHA